MTVKKISKIERIISSCRECGYRRGKTCIREGELIKNQNTIPNWCPLEDYKKIVGR